MKFYKQHRHGRQSRFVLRLRSPLPGCIVAFQFASLPLTEKFTVSLPSSKACDLQCPPKFIVPLKMHAAPQGYECYMSCAIKGDPTPHVTWLRNNVSLNTNTNYHITNTCGVCSLLILRVGAKDTGEYKIVAENAMGRAECSTKLTVRGGLLVNKGDKIPPVALMARNQKMKEHLFFCFFFPPE